MNLDHPAPTVGLSVRSRGRFWVGMVLGALILVCGMAIGSGGTVLWIGHRMKQLEHGPERMPIELAERVRTSLELSDEQAGRVAGILRRRHEALMKLHRDTLKGELDALRAEVASVLTPEQAKRWNDDFDSIMRPPPFPPGPGGPAPRGGPPPQEGDRLPPPGPPMEH